MSKGKISSPTIDLSGQEQYDTPATDNPSKEGADREIPVRFKSTKHASKVRNLGNAPQGSNK